MSINSASRSDRFHHGRSWALVHTCLALILLALSGCGTEQAETDIEPYPPPNPIFYELANSSGEVEGWLLGTIHALPDGVSWRTPAIDHAVAEADLLYVEIADLNNRAANSALFQQLATTDGLGPLDERLPPTFHATIAEVLDRGDFDADDFASTEDWAAAVMLSRVDAVGEPANGVDRAMIADFAGRDVRAFETTASQLAIFDGLDADAQSRLLQETLLEYNKSRENPGWLIRAWLGGNVTELEQSVFTGILAVPELERAFLRDRNTAWMEQLVPVLNEDPKPLVAVGAAHLVGPNGLVAMLDRAGYSVARLPAS